MITWPEVNEGDEDGDVSERENVFYSTDDLMGHQLKKKKLLKKAQARYLCNMWYNGAQ